MIKIYADNGLPFQMEAEINWREFLTKQISGAMEKLLKSQNRAWIMHRIEAPSLIPTIYVSAGYASEVFAVEEYNQPEGGQLILKPETTGSSYAYAKYLMRHQRFVPPVCVWQLSKSFRRENDQVAANVRLKEFYQLEFQCIVAADSNNNYQETILGAIADMLQLELGLKTRLVESDRLPSYSTKTMDIEVKTPKKWLEVMSCSIRDDVPFAWEDRGLINYEFAFGMDRLVYAKGL